ncbi:hypothetical protein [Burkholderia cepacia]|uniref:hypothetical protein n=1 Tax=Burkholderia cepacia TaxID=292 RepID=UPI000A51371B|nr:hypothetical protein [Burkholderia cepacia]MCA8075807.1 hypothetical protein [Burkholderia cepacia]MCA8324597.1 hypothetical protein [Burkholderia cepacia]
MKPRWAYIWEYTNIESGERLRTRVPVTVGEFHAMTGQFPDESDALPVEETKVDRNVVRLTDLSVRRVPKMPEFVSPSESELRELWRTHHDPEVRRLILEIVTLRKSLKKIMDCGKLPMAPEMREAFSVVQPATSCGSTTCCGKKCSAPG